MNEKRAEHERDSKEQIRKMEDRKIGLRVHFPPPFLPLILPISHLLKVLVVTTPKHAATKATATGA